MQSDESKSQSLLSNDHLTKSSRIQSKTDKSLQVNNNALRLNRLTKK